MEETRISGESEWIRLGAKLRQAREHAGFRQEDVAHLLKVSRPTISAMESGKTKVDSLLLSRLAKLYRVDTGFFFGEESEPSLIDQMIINRLGDLSPRDKLVIANFLEFCENLSFLRELLDSPQRQLPPQTPMPLGTRKYAADAEAKKERRRLGLGNAPIGDRIFNLLDMLGLPTYRASLEDSHISGFVVDHPQAGPVIFINAAQYHWRQVFTAAHEYGHFLFHRTLQPVACRIFAAESPLAEVSAERFANAFASEFLMPEDGIEDLLVTLGASAQPPSPETVVRLQRHFGVSFQAMLYRLLHLGLMRESNVQRMKGEVNPLELIWKMGFPLTGGDLGESTTDETDLWLKFPTSFIEMTIDAFESGLISNGRAAELVELNRGTFDMFYRQRRRAKVAFQAEEDLKHVVA